MDVHSEEAQPDITSTEVEKSPSNGVTSSGGGESEVVPVRPTELEMVEDEGAADVMIEMTENCPLTPVTAQTCDVIPCRLVCFCLKKYIPMGMCMACRSLHALCIGCLKVPNI